MNVTLYRSDPPIANGRSGGLCKILIHTYIGTHTDTHTQHTHTHTYTSTNSSMDAHAYMDLHFGGGIKGENLDERRKEGG